MTEEGQVLQLTTNIRASSLEVKVVIALTKFFDILYHFLFFCFFCFFFYPDQSKTTVNKYPMHFVLGCTFFDSSGKLIHHRE